MSYSPHIIDKNVKSTDALAARSGLGTATLVQRFGSKDGLKRGALQLAWARLQTETVQLAGSLPKTPEGATSLLVGLSKHHGGIDSFAEGLLLLRENLRDPALRALGAVWKSALCHELNIFSTETTRSAEKACCSQRTGKVRCSGGVLIQPPRLRNMSKVACWSSLALSEGTEMPVEVRLFPLPQVDT